MYSCQQICISGSVRFGWIMMHNEQQSIAAWNEEEGNSFLQIYYHQKWMYSKYNSYNIELKMIPALMWKRGGGYFTFLGFIG